ncbi:MAG: nucleoside kinase [Kiritimatiellae bacterium]|nr:nucleoside kinase [Kiritimatiellia bacterium]
MHAAGDAITVTLENNRQVQCLPGTLVRDLLPGRTSKDSLHYVGALVNNDVVSLSYALEVDSQVTFLTMADSHGWRIYRSSLAFLLTKTVHDVFPDATLYIEHSLGTGFYCNFEIAGQAGITEEQLGRLDAKMRELIAADLPIERRKFFFADAIKYFEEHQYRDKYNLLRFSNPPKIVVHWCDGFMDLAHGPLADRTGSIPHYQLVPYPPGFVLQLPDRESAPAMPAFERQPHLFQIFREYKEWGRILGIRTVGDLNQIIAKGEIGEIIKIAEAFHEKKLAAIADHIRAFKDRIKWVLIAGPSSAGKTTFAKRLAVQLRVNGLQPLTISVDDYFVNREDTPLDADGHYDFENIQTIDLDLFNRHIRDLDEGREVELPHFNFSKGLREFRGEKLQITGDQLVLVEGIHSLNPRLTEALPAEHKFKIYISALTQINLDFNNRVSTTDNRLLRRLVRDHRYRGNTALTTLQMWPGVRRGEKQWVFPYQQEADVAFNSALDYELAVLKPLAEPLLAEVKPYDAQYADARRLQAFLASFISAPSSAVPPTSILREFIGQSGFRY